MDTVSLLGGGIRGQVLCARIDSVFPGSAVQQRISKRL